MLFCQIKLVSQLLLWDGDGWNLNYNDYDMSGISITIIRWVEVIPIQTIRVWSQLWRLWDESDLNYDYEMGESYPNPNKWTTMIVRKNIFTRFDAPWTIINNRCSISFLQYIQILSHAHFSFTHIYFHISLLLKNIVLQRVQLSHHKWVISLLNKKSFLLIYFSYLL